MKIELKAIKIKDLVEGFKDDDEAGVVGFSGKLDIRPPYQREFRYNSMQQEAVINCHAWVSTQYNVLECG